MPLTQVIYLSFMSVSGGIKRLMKTETYHNSTYAHKCIGSHFFSKLRGLRQHVHTYADLKSNLACCQPVTSRRRHCWYQQGHVNQQKFVRPKVAIGYTRALIKLMLRGRLKGMIKDQQGKNRNKYICQKTISNAVTWSLWGWRSCAYLPCLSQYSFCFMVTRMTYYTRIA